MKPIRIAMHRRLNRRTFLRGAGVALALPMLDAMTPALLRRASATETAAPPRCLLAICNNLGLLPDRFFPQTAGQGYALSPYLAEISDLRDDFTVLDGVSHPGVDGSHSSDVSFLTAAPHPGGVGASPRQVDPALEP
ncbi:MAG: DUF1552 domain-containing protein [Planctomycetes bacterium]|nr:DUF1552 domain-containing protein [Planctomycetota bacterium]